MYTLEIRSHSLEKIEDPFGILSGERYEIYLHIEVPEDDELYSEKGLKIKVLFIVEENHSRISHYHIIENETNEVLDFELEEEEEKLVEEYCKKILTE